MYKRQKQILLNFIIVIVITITSIIAMIYFRDYVNHTEAMRAMKHLGKIATEHREKYNYAPPETQLDRIIKTLRGSARIGQINYRARWIRLDSTEDEILAYVEKNYFSPFIRHGFIVLRLDGRVEWMKKKEFKELLAQQQTPTEIELMKK